MGYLLLTILVIPLLGGFVGMAMPTGRAARLWALAVSLVVLGVAVALVGLFDYRHPGVQIVLRPDMFALEDIGFRFSLGIDSISLWLVALTAVLMPLALVSSWGSIRDREQSYYSWMQVLLAAMMGVFIARDLLLFYVFFELTLVPMFFIIGIWGGPERRYAAIKFFLFTFAGSVLTLAGAIYLGLNAGEGGASFDISDVVRYAQTGITPVARYWVFLAMLAGFAVKVPLFPVHTWLPLAHTEAPTAGSVILAGVLLKLGTYGLLRLAIPIGLPDVTIGLAKFLGVLCLIGIIYGALVAWVQQDIKKLVAYSSVSHLGFCVLGLVALNEIGIQGSVLYMINHGLSTGALFLVVGMIYDRYHTRDINELSGLAKRMPRLAFFFVLFALSSIGLPGLNGFVSEFLTILGAFTSPYLGIGYGVVAAVGIILGAIYMLHMLARVVWGPLKTPQVHGAVPGDIGGREVVVLVPLALAVVFLGVAPNTVLNSLYEPVGQTLTTYHLVEVKDKTGQVVNIKIVGKRLTAEAAGPSGK